MKSNFIPSPYSFTSCIPDILSLSEISSPSVVLSIFLNGEQTSIFSTTLYTYRNTVSIYDIRSIIESYMEEKQWVYATLSIQVSAGGESHRVGECTLIYSRLDRTDDAKSFLQSHFLTSHSVRMVPHGFALSLSYLLFPNESAQCSATFILRQSEEDAPITYMLNDTVIQSTEQELHTERLTEEALLALLPEGVSGTLLSLTLSRGKRSFTIYITEETPTLTLGFTNEFNIQDTLYLTALNKQKLNFDRSTATCCGVATFYDEHSRPEFESESSSLSYALARYLTLALQSDSVSMVSDAFPDGTPILITEIESELSDASNALNKVKFNWRPTNRLTVLPFARKKEIFNDIYNTSFD